MKKHERIQKTKESLTKSELRKLIQHEIRRVMINNFLDLRSEMNDRLFDTFDEKYLPKIVEEVSKLYSKID